jgi:hypothetical protein
VILEKGLKMGFTRSNANNVDFMEDSIFNDIGCEVEHLKKQSAILYSHLNQEYQTYTFSMEECNEIVAKMNGFLSWRSVEEFYSSNMGEVKPEFPAGVNGR